MNANPIAKFAAGIGAVMVAASTQGANFAYNPTDLLLGFRNGGVNDFVVDLGPVTSWYAYSALSPNTTYNITAYNATQLTTVFGSLDNISFSAFADVRVTSNPSFPIQTIWTTTPRLSLATPADPLSRRSQFQQATTGAKIDGIANGAITYSGLPDNTGVSTAAVLEIPSSWNANGTSYTIGVGSSGNFSGTFGSSVENTTPTGFAGGGIPIVSDLYEMQPGSGSGKYLGYFTLGTDGSMAFTTVPEPGSLALVGAGFGLFGVARYFRRNSQV
jgi:hypothetical protein